MQQWRTWRKLLRAGHALIFRKNVNGCVRRPTHRCLGAWQRRAMLNFSWEAVGKELQTKAPLSLRCILAAAHPSNGTTTIYYPVGHPGVYTAAEILLKKRDKAIGLIPYVISTMLKVSKTSKMVRSKTKPVLIQFQHIFCNQYCELRKRLVFVRISNYDPTWRQFLGV